jgi:thioredoxin-related protein
MYKHLLTALIIGTFGLSITGCNDSNEAKVVQTKKEQTDVIKAKTETVSTQAEVLKSKNQVAQAAEIFYGTFKDVAKIGPEGKSEILIFGANSDPYTMKLKEDVFKSKVLQNRFKNDFSSYYLKSTENLRHKLFHEGEYMDVDTKTMISIYGITGTPTIIFTDEKGKAVIVVPGYMPTKQFLATMDFMDSKKWQGKDRKNGEVYESLRNFYLTHGIKIKKAK